MTLSARRLGWIALASFLPLHAAEAQADSLVTTRGDSVAIHLVNADLRLAVQALSPYLDRPVMFGTMADLRITLETPRPVLRDSLPELLRGMLKLYGLDLASQNGFYTISATPNAAPGQRPGAPPPGAPGAAGPIQLFVLHIRHARASDVAATVNALYGKGGALGELGAPLSTLPDALRQNLIPPAGALEPGQPRPVVNAPAQLSGDVTIVPDARTNSLLIRATPVDYALIQAAVEQLDARPLQVLIEVIIAEVRRDRSHSFGLEAILPKQSLGVDDAEISGSSTGLGPADFVLNVMRLGSIDLNATLSAEANRGNVTILSRPVVFAANNENAEILVGSQRPFVQVQRALPTDNPVRDQVVQFKDVGTRLTVVPTISDDGYVMLRVAQEVNAATAEIAFDAPVISTRTITTQLLVKDGQTAVLGGLTDKQRDEVRTGIPVLSSIPLLGGLFGRHVTRTVETELYVFLTPRVVRTDDDLQAVTDSAGEKTQKMRREVQRKKQ